LPPHLISTENTKNTIGEMDEIPSLDLRAQYQSIKSEIDNAIARVLERGFFILGEEVTLFELEFARYIRCSHAVGVGNGTDAIELALRACEIQPGDEVITAANTAVATVAAIELAGARPVLVDVDPLRYTIDPELVLPAITPRTRAIIPVHLYGCPADIVPLLAIARQNDLLLIEDCAQAHGALYEKRRVGSWGDAAAFSFYPTKNLGAFGDAGAIVTSNPHIAEKARLIRQYGWRERYISIYKGTNSRLDDMQAAILRVKLNHLERWNARRRYLAGLYYEGLSQSNVFLPRQPEKTYHVYHQYVIRCQNRDYLRERLKAANIQTQILYPVPIHMQPAFIDLGYHAGDFPITERLASEILSLPLYPEMDEASISRICQTIVENS
jgi:dTDP-4-amino-4,6-dideoxygalactose transaminase